MMSQRVGCFSLLAVLTAAIVASATFVYTHAHPTSSPGPTTGTAPENPLLHHLAQNSSGSWVVLPGPEPTAVASAYYNESWFDTGQNFLQIRTNPDFDSSTQAYAAGMYSSCGV